MKENGLFNIGQRWHGIDGKWIDGSSFNSVSVEKTRRSDNDMKKYASNNTSNGATSIVDNQMPCSVTWADIVKSSNDCGIVLKHTATDRFCDELSVS